MSVIGKSAIAYLGLGSNLDDRMGAMRGAVAALDEHPRIEVDPATGLASLFQTRAVGGPAGQPDYLNSVVRVKTSLTPHGLLSAALDIERGLGRVRHEQWDARAIDIDVLLFDELIVDDAALSIPHPRLHERRFVLVPLAEIADDVRHPGLGITVAALLARLEPSGGDEDVVRVWGRGWLFDVGPSCGPATEEQEAVP